MGRLNRKSYSLGTLTLAVDSSVLCMATVVIADTLMGTVTESPLLSCTLNVVKVDGPSALSIICASSGYCACACACVYSRTSKSIVIASS